MIFNPRGELHRFDIGAFPSERALLFPLMWLKCLFLFLPLFDWPDLSEVVSQTAQHGTYFSAPLISSYSIASDDRNIPNISLP